MIFIIKGFQTIVFIFIVISSTFRPICPPAFFRCLSNSVSFTELRTTSFIESTGVACSDSVSHNRVHVLSIPVLLVTCSEDWSSVKVPEFDKHLKKARGHISRNVVEIIIIIIKMKTLNDKNQSFFVHSHVITSIIHHHVVTLAQISLTLSRHFPLSFIASGRSSGLHPVSSHSCCMSGLVIPLLLGHMWGSIGVHYLWARPCFSSCVLHVWFV